MREFHKYLSLCIAVFAALNCYSKDGKAKESGSGAGASVAAKVEAKSGAKKKPSRMSTVVKRVAPAVVNITCERTEEYVNPFAGDPFFSFFFGPTQHKSKASGSGVIVEQKYVITCAHVVSHADNIKVTLSNNVTFKAHVVMVNDSQDLAVLRLDLKDESVQLPSLQVMRDDVEIGDCVLAFGNSFGVGQTVTHGIISARNRVFGNRVMMQTDAPINPGNSGGPIVTMDGEIAGIASAIATKSGASHGVGFFIPAKAVQHLLDQAIHGAKESWFPIEVQTADASVIENLIDRGVLAAGGVIVTSVQDGFGLEPGDIVLSFAGHQISNKETFDFLAALVPIGESCPVTIIKPKDMALDGVPKVNTIHIKAQEKPELRTEKQQIEITGSNVLSGVTVTDITPENIKKFNLHVDHGALVVAAPKGNIAMPGDVIIGLNGKNIVVAKDVADALSSKSAGFAITIQRGLTTIQQSVIR
ncbi:MAG: trypsin-like peptidase domain-containing protein [Holosporales bacterium]|jgi:S1-C subfamily serine protease|nr:trypsin-like peptidase domain-containing protein [Holosporales bacterium]